MDRPHHLTTFEQYPQPADEARATAEGQLSGGAHSTVPGAGTRSHSRYTKIARALTKSMLRTMELLMSSTISVQGARNIGTGPVLYVANHFTRFETFILPWLISNVHGGRLPLSLAFHELFRGRFGDLLMTIGARPTGDPVVKHTIVEDLMTGREDWLIYPEGSMIKNKKIWAANRFAIDSPDRAGSAHSGAAIMALKAMLYRKLYDQACRTGDPQLKERYQARYHLAGPQDIAVPDLRVIPVNITYYPLRPGNNVLYRAARWLFRQLPSVLAEELVIEGSLLLKKTDISVYFGKPISLERYINLMMPTLLAPMPFVEQLRSANRTLGVLKNRLTRRMMHEIYTRLTINFDHLFAYGLRALDAHAGADAAAGAGVCTKVARADFHQALYLAARKIQANGQRCSHPSIGPDLIGLLCDEQYPALESVCTLAKEEGILSVADGDYRVDRAVLRKEHAFHDIRLKNTLAVIANELEPLRASVRHLRNAINLPRTVLRREITALLRQEEQDDFIAERDACGSAPLQNDAFGRPFILERPADRVGIVLCHGYLSAPEEVRLLAEHLFAAGFSVHVPRLPGHGTSAVALASVRVEEWRRAYERAYLAMRNTDRDVIVAGFSAGGLLALETAARHPEVAGVIAINPSLRIVDPKNRLVPAVWWWNRLLSAIRCPFGRFDHVVNEAENPQVNYPHNYINGLYQLRRLISGCRKVLGRISVPALIVQGDRDPVVSPDCGAQVIGRIASEEKQLAMMSFKRHVIVRGEGHEVVLQRVEEFARTLAERRSSARLEHQPHDPLIDADDEPDVRISTR